jgi:anti-anti-sigma factor
VDADCPLTVSLLPCGDAVRIVCDGELDGPHAGELIEVVELCLEAEPSAVTIDCRGATFLGSAGLAAVLDAVARCRASGVEPALVLSDVARRLFDLCDICLDAQPGEAGAGRAVTIAHPHTSLAAFSSRARRPSRTARGVVR